SATSSALCTITVILDHHRESAQRAHSSARFLTFVLESPSRAIVIADSDCLRSVFLILSATLRIAERRVQSAAFFPESLSVVWSKGYGDKNGQNAKSCLNVSRGTFKAPR